MNNKLFIRLLVFLFFCFSLQSISAAITITLARTNGTCASNGTVTATVKYLTASDPEVKFASIKKETDSTWSPQQSYTTNTVLGTTTTLTFVFNNRTSGVYRVEVYDANSGSVTSATTITVANPTPGVLALNAPGIGNLTPTGCADDGSISIAATQSTITRPYTYHLYGGPTSRPDTLTERATNAVHFRGLSTGTYSVSVTDGCGTTVQSTNINVTSKYNLSDKTFAEFDLGGTTAWDVTGTTCGVSFTRSLANVYLKDTQGNVLFKRSSGSELPPFTPPIEGRVEYPAGSGQYTPWGTLTNFEIPESIYKPSITKYNIQLRHPCKPDEIITSQTTYNLVYPFERRTTTCGWEIYRVIKNFQCGNIDVKLELKSDPSKVYYDTWDGSGASHALDLLEVPDGIYKIYITTANDTYQLSDITVKKENLLNVDMRADIYNYTRDRGCDFTTGAIRVTGVPVTNTIPITYTMLSGPDGMVLRDSVVSAGNLILWDNLPPGTYRVKVDRGGCGVDIQTRTLTLPFSGFDADELTYTSGFSCGKYKIQGKGWYLATDGSVSTATTAYGASIFDAVTGVLIGEATGGTANNKSFLSTKDIPAGSYRVSFSSHQPSANSCKYVDRYITITDNYISLKFDMDRSGGLICSDGFGDFHLETTGGSGDAVKYRIKKKGDPDTLYSAWNVSQDFLHLEAGEYTAQADDGCETITQNFNLIKGNSIAKFDVSGEIVTTGDSAQFCMGSNIVMALKITGRASNVKWKRPDKTEVAGQIINIPYFAVRDTGMYVTTYMSSGCSWTDSVRLKLPPRPEFHYADTSVCFPSTVDLTTMPLSSGDVIGLDLKYYDSSDVELPNAVISTVGTGTYKIIGTNSAGCSWITTVDITIHPVVVATVIGTSTVCSGSELTYTTESGMNNYVWTVVGGNIISGGTATDATVTVRWGNASSGSVSVGYTNLLGCSTQVPATQSITIRPLVSIGTQPASSVALCQGDALNLSVTARGHTPTYQWYFNGSAISGATSSSYTIASSQTTNTGSYYVIVTDTCNFVQSDVSNVSITQPAFEYGDSAICGPGTIDLTGLTLISGDIAGLTFKYYDSSDVELTNTVISTVGTSTYKIIGTNSTGCSWTSTVEITIHPVVVATVIGTSTVCSGTELTYTTESGMNNYVWAVVGGNIISGGTATDATVTVRWGAAPNSSVSVGYTNLLGCSTQVPATQSITIRPLVSISTQPASIVVLCQGDALNLSVTASGHTLTYQWYFNGSAISGATSSSYTLASAQTTNTGSYHVIVTDTCNSVQSDISDVSITQPAFKYGDSAICAPGTIDLTGLTLVSGDIAGLTFKYFNSSDVELPNTVISTIGTSTYKIIGTNSTGCSWITTVDITIHPVVVATVTGTSTVCSGSELTYTTESVMNNYVWTVGGGNIISGGTATDATVTVRWGAASSGSVSVGYANSVGCSTSVPAVESITIRPLVAITTQPASIVALCQGDALNLSVTASGHTPTYQWYFNGSAISGATSSSYTLASAQTANTGSYYVIVTDTCNSVQSTSSEVNIVQVTPEITGPVTVYTGLEYSYQGNGGIGASNYYWGTTNGSILGGQGTNDASISWNVPGTDVITLTYNQGACQGTNTLEVEILSSGNSNDADFSVNEAIQCLSDNTYSFTNTTDISLPNVLVGYFWNFGDNSTSTEPNPIHKYADGGTYVVTLIAYGILANDTVYKTIKVLAPMVVRPADQIVCAGNSTEEVVLKGTADRYSWTGGVSIGLADGTDKSRIPSFIAKNNSGFPVTDTIVLTPMMMVNDLVCYGDTVKFHITVNPLTVPTIIGVDDVCSDSEVTYTTESGMNNYEWAVSGGEIVSGGSSADHSITIRWDSSGEGSVSVNYMNKTGCSSGKSASKSVTLNSETKIIVHPVSTQVLCAGEELNMNVEAIGVDVSYQWYLNGQPIDGACEPNYNDPNCNSSKNGKYHVKISGACNSVLSEVAEVRVGISDIVVQKWENVLAVECLPSENGGYEFVDFQWYKNGSLMAGEIKSYLYAGALIDYSAVYTVKLTTKTGAILHTCGNTFVPKNNILITASPNPVDRGQMLKIRATGISNTTSVELILTDYKGQIMQRLSLKGNETDIKMPNHPGVYILRVNLNTSKVESKYFKIIVP